MKIAITGGTAGIGQALGNEYKSRGHEVISLSRRTGHNIRVIPKTANAIEPCDVFINNAQVGFAQTELLFEMVRRWKGSRKQIIVIGTMMTLSPISTMSNMEEYYVQKSALDQAVQQIRQTRPGVILTMVRPGDIATSENKTVPPSADVNVWANTLVHTLEMAQANGLFIPDISLGPAHQ
jgi:NADP-dependent 3-hydroxy acid dehydrogenase YdfG